MSEDEFDRIPDLFSSVTDAEWSRILDVRGESSTIRRTQGASPSRSTASTDYGDDSFMDPEVLAEIDRIEASLSSVGGTASARRVGVPFPHIHCHGNLMNAKANSTANEHITHRHDSLRRNSTALFACSDSECEYLAAINNSSPLHHLSDANHRPPPRVLQTSVACPTEATEKQATEKSEGTESPGMKKRKRQAIDQVERVLEGYGEELCCPICCDLFVATHLGNPCGHSYCGDCAWQWINKNDQNECPICRTKLVGDAPLIPNITLDSLIEKHIELLISAGAIDWLPEGSKFKERASRKVKWKASADARLKAQKTKQKRKEAVLVSSDDEDPYAENSSREAGQIEMVRTRSNRRPRNSRQRRR